MVCGGTASDLKKRGDELARWGGGGERRLNQERN